MRSRCRSRQPSKRGEARAASARLADPRTSPTNESLRSAERRSARGLDVGLEGTRALFLVVAGGAASLAACCHLGREPGVEHADVWMTVGYAVLAQDARWGLAQ